MRSFVNFNNYALNLALNNKGLLVALRGKKLSIRSIAFKATSNEMYRYSLLFSDMTERYFIKYSDMKLSRKVT